MLRVLGVAQTMLSRVVRRFRADGREARCYCGYKFNSPKTKNLTKKPTGVCTYRQTGNKMRMWV
jgi:hypothetical protein